MLYVIFKIRLSKSKNYLNIMVFFTVIRGYIKTNFNVFSNSFKTIGNGSITDGHYKLEIQISEYKHDIKFEKGQQVELKGYIKIISKLY